MSISIDYVLQKSIIFWGIIVIAIILYIIVTADRKIFFKKCSQFTYILTKYFLKTPFFKHLQTFFVVGPAIGYMAGGAFLNIYTDVDSGIEIKDLNSNSPLWVGAWWIGFIVAVFMSWSCALFISK